MERRKRRRWKRLEEEVGVEGAEKRGEYSRWGKDGSKGEK